MAFSFAVHAEASGSKVINSSVPIKDQVVPFNRGILNTSRGTTDCPAALNSAVNQERGQARKIVQEQRNETINIHLHNCIKVLQHVKKDRVSLTNCPRGVFSFFN